MSPPLVCVRCNQRPAVTGLGHCESCDEIIKDLADHNRDEPGEESA